MSPEASNQLCRNVQAVLHEALSLGPRAYELTPQSGLLGVLPELDSQAVFNVLLGLEEQFGITIDDDDVDAEVFATLGSLMELVARKMASQ